jgi:chemotaxis protein methyltransferase CheR
MSVEANIIEKEFAFTDRDFDYISQIVGERVGIDLPKTKRELIYGRLAKRLRKLGIKSFKEYCDRLEQGDEEEFTNFINAITTNVTSFFRENHHFEFLRNTLLPGLIQKQQYSSQPRLRIWSAGCSSGREPYTIAMVLKETIPDLDRWDAKILATDLDSHILEVARKGVYSIDHLNEIPQESQKRWLKVGHGSNEGDFIIRNELKQLISFRQLNLLSSWPMQGLFDFIFCRNVTIYFDTNNRMNIVNRFADQLVDDGHLFVGHSESLFGLTHRFKPVGHTIHLKTA